MQLVPRHHGVITRGESKPVCALNSTCVRCREGTCSVSSAVKEARQSTMEGGAVFMDSQLPTCFSLATGRLRSQNGSYLKDTTIATINKTHAGKCRA